MMSRIPLAAVTALAVLALAGCAADGTDTATGASGTPSATVTTVSPGAAVSGSAGAPSATQQIGEDLLVFTRQGGIAGTNDKLVLKSDGSYTASTKAATRTGKLTGQELATVKATLASVDFNKMPTTNTGGNVADGYKYSVTYAGREITAEDGAVPAALQPVIGALSALLSK